MHCVQVLAALGVGGSELVATELTEHLAARGDRLTVIAGPGPLTKRVQAAGAEWLDWPIGRKRPTTFWLAWRLRRWLAAEQPDVLHVHSRFPALIVQLALRGLAPRPALVTSMHGHYSVNPYSAVMTRADRVIAVSQHMRDYTLRHYPRLDPERVVTVPGGVDRDRFRHGHRPDEGWYRQLTTAHPELRGRRWLLLPGRLSRWKGHEDFLRLVDAVRGAADDVHGVIVGPGRTGSGYRRELDARVRELGLDRRISFVGQRDDMADWYAAAAIVYNLSDGPPEAFGRTVLEALSVGTPVLAWDQGGPAEQLRALYPEGRVPVGDHATLRQRTLALLERPVTVPPGDAYTLGDSMDRTLAVYADAMARRACAG
jgi:glycosyltransferase involved in cell wall biosynthesis